MCDSDDFSGLFGGGSDTPDTSSQGSATPSPSSDSSLSGGSDAAAPSSDTSSFSTPLNLSALGISGSPSSVGSVSSPSVSAPSSGAASPDLSNISSFLAGGSAPTGGSPSAAGASLGGGSLYQDPSLAADALGVPSTPAGSGTPSPAGSTSPSTMSSIMQSLGLSGSGSPSTGNLLGSLLSGGALAYKALDGTGSSSAEKAVKGEAANANAQGQQLESYLANGTLPPGAQQYVNQQVAAQQASIKSKYAQLGMTGSTAEAQELSNVNTQAQAQMFQIANDLYQTGVSQTGASATLYNTLLNAQNADNASMGSAIQNFAASLAGGSGQKYTLQPSSV